MPDKSSWLIVSYAPGALFALKRSNATTMAAKTNLLPTPYAIKMALLKVLIQSQGAEQRSDFDRWIEAQFQWIRPLKIHISPPSRLVVNRNSYKKRYYDQNEDNPKRKTMALQSGFTFGESVYLDGRLQICCGPTNKLDELERLFGQINYFGKRGSFFQYMPDENYVATEIPEEFQLPMNCVVQPWDDIPDGATFAGINPFSAVRSRADKDRVIKLGFLPLKLTASSTRYDFFERTSN